MENKYRVVSYGDYSYGAQVKLWFRPFKWYKINHNGEFAQKNDNLTSYIQYCPAHLHDHFLKYTNGKPVLISNVYVPKRYIT